MQGCSFLVQLGRWVEHDPATARPCGRVDRAGVVSRTPCLPFGRCGGRQRSPHRDGILRPRLGGFGKWGTTDMNSLDDAAPGVPKHGTQGREGGRFLHVDIRLASTPGVFTRFVAQGGPLSGLPFTCCPTSFHSRFEAQLFRVLLLRRLWLPLLPTSRSCRCGRPLDALGHHRAACPNVGVLGRRGFALESAVARLVAVSQSTLQFATSTLECLTRPSWKSWLTAFLCSTGPSLGWTPLSCLCCAGWGHLTLGVQTKTEQFWLLNWLVNTAAKLVALVRGVSPISLLVGQGQGAAASQKSAVPS